MSRFPIPFTIFGVRGMLQVRPVFPVKNNPGVMRFSFLCKEETGRSYDKGNPMILDLTLHHLGKFLVHEPIDFQLTTQSDTLNKPHKLSVVSVDGKIKFSASKERVVVVEASASDFNLLKLLIEQTVPELLRWDQCRVSTRYEADFTDAEIAPNESTRTNPCVAHFFR